MMKLDLDGNLLKRTSALESGKVNLNAGNLNATGKATICGLSCPNYSAGSDITSTIFAASGTGYKPTKKGFLLIHSYNSVGSSTISIYNNSGTAIINGKLFNVAPSPNSHGSTCQIACDETFSIRISQQAGTAGTDFWAYFYPMKGN